MARRAALRAALLGCWLGAAGPSSGAEPQRRALAPSDRWRDAGWGNGRAAGLAPPPRRRLAEGGPLAVSTDERLRPAFEWNAALPPNLRHQTRVAHPRILRVGNVLVQEMDTPKEEAQPGANAALSLGDDEPLSLLDTLTALPAPGAPATARIQVELFAANQGANRLHAFVRINAEECEGGRFTNATHNFTTRLCVPAYDAPAHVLSAVLAPIGDPDAVVRPVELRLADYAAAPGEWHEVLGDFYVLPSEYGTGLSRIKLYVTLGSPLATEGRVSLTDLTVTPLPLHNVALEKAIAEGGSVSSRSAGYNQPPDNSILTDGVLIGQPWYTIDQMRPPTPIKFVVELGELYYVCSCRVEFTSGQVVDWMLYISLYDGGHDASGLSNFTQVLRVKDENWQDWASQRLANPTSDKKRWFPCTHARRARLQLNDTANAIFALTEIELYGYPMARYVRRPAPFSDRKQLPRGCAVWAQGMCRDRCRHGGGCMHEAQRCSCPRKWGWRGPTCNLDVNECTLPRDSQVAAERVPTIVHDNGGCGLGDAFKSNCTNLPGSWSCACNDGSV